MKKYRGMYKYYFDEKDKGNVPNIVSSLRDNMSSITPNFMINGYPSFIVYCDEMLHELAEIRDKNLSLDRMSKKLPNVAKQQFLRQAIIEEIHQTNEMENIHSTRKEISDVMKVIENGHKGKRFDGMIRKYQLLQSKEKIPLSSCQDVRNLYDSFVLDEVVKEDPKDAPDGLYFRKNPVSVMKWSKLIHEGIYPESSLNKAMENALLFLNDSDYDPLIRVAAFHYMFCYAHPFYNGNGRMTRFISSSRLQEANIGLIVALRLSYVIKSHRTQYYEMFKITNDKRNYGDMTLFVVRFLKFINEACDQVIDFLQEKYDLLNHYFEVIGKMELDSNCQNILFILAQVSVCDGDRLSVKALSEISEESLYMVKKCIQKIEPYCIKQRQGHAQSYQANLEALDNIDENPHT